MNAAIITLKVQGEYTFKEATQILKGMQNKMYPDSDVKKRVMLRGRNHIMKISQS